MLGTSSMGNSSFGYPMDAYKKLSKLRVVNAINSDRLKAVSLSINNETKIKSISYKTATCFINLTPGVNKIRLTSTVVQTILFDADIVTKESENYTLVFYKSKDGKLATKFITNDKQLPEDRHAKVRFIHTTPFIGDVDLWMNDMKSHSNIGFNGVSNKYVEVESDNYQISVMPKGSDKSILPVVSASFSSKSIHTMILIGTPEDPVLLLLDDLDGSCIPS